MGYFCLLFAVSFFYKRLKVRGLSEGYIKDRFYCNFFRSDPAELERFYKKTDYVKIIFIEPG